jgi:RHS repeat-associated protein
MYKKLVMSLIASVVSWGTAAASAFQDVLVQAPSIGTPQRGSLAGTLSKLAFGPGDLARGTYALPLPVALPSDRGPILANVIPSYSPETGITEWGMGWQAELKIQRFQPRGEVNFVDDQFTSPWGQLVRGDDGNYYPLGMTSVMRVSAAGAGWVATTSDGTRYRFDAADSVVTTRGTFAWMLSRVDTVLGDSTTLSWTRNPSGRPFLSSVQWGGRGDGTQYQLSFVYEPVARPFLSYLSGAPLVLDQRIKQLTVEVKQGASYAVRWMYDASYIASPSGPAYYLAQITRRYASGAADPPITYDYDLNTELWSQTRLLHSPTLDDFIVTHGSTAIQPDHATLLDLEEDGLLDLETAFDQTLVHQSATGYTIEPLAPAGAPTDPLCRPTPSSFNKPRTLARMHGGAAEPQVVVLRKIGFGGSTRLLVCDRRGAPIYDQNQAGNWELGATTRLADIDFDKRPDLVRLTTGQVSVLHNTSSGPQSLSFEPGPVTALSPAVAPVAAWALDLNGDARADLLVKHANGVLVWLGTGGGAFDPQGKSFAFTTAAGSPLIGLGGYQFSFGDFNGDGLSDVLLSQGQTLLMFTNTGTEFIETPIPGLIGIPWTVTFPVIADLAGTGNEAAMFVNGDQALSIQLTSPSTGLLRTADDGMGTVVHFGYGRAFGYPGLVHRYATLGSLTVESSGYDTVAYGYLYGTPVLHSLGKYLVGFGNVDKHSPVLTERVLFFNSDDFSGVHAGSADTDDRSPGIVRFETRQYSDVRFHGVRWLRPLSVEAGHRTLDSLVTLSTTTTYTVYQREVCPTVTVSTTPSGQLTTTTTLASVAAIPDDVSCLPASRSLVGTHSDPALDFNYMVGIDRNGLGQPTRITRYGASVDLQVLQDISYDADHRIASIGAPGHGATQPRYDGLGRLATVTDPIGLITRVRSFDPVTDALQVIETSRPWAPSTASFIYDGRERLQASWDDVSGASQAMPVAAYSYRDPTNTLPGRIDTLTLADAVAGTSRHAIDLFAADGELMVEGAWLGDHASLGMATTIDRNAVTTRWRFVGPISAAALDAMTSAGLRGTGTTLEETVHAGFGDATRTTVQQQDGVTGVTTGELELAASELITRVHAPGGFTSESAVDASGKLVRRTDENGVTHRYAYDALGRLVHIATPDGGHAIAFDGFGRPSRVTRDGVGAIAFTYDPMSGLPVRKQWLDEAGAVTSTSDTTYDATGRPTAVAQTADGSATKLGYDHDGQLDGATLPGQLGRTTRVRGEGWQRTMLYDPLGRAYQQHTSLTGWRELTRDKVFRVDGSIASDTLTITDAANQVRLTTTRETVLDALGRVSQIKVDGAVLYTLTYDPEGRVARADFASGEALTFAYDATTHERRGHDVSAPDASGGVHWERDARGLIASETYSHGAATTLRTYRYDGRGALLRSEAPGATATYTYTASGLPASAIDALGTRTVHRDGATLAVGDVMYGWDAAGRVVARGDWSFTYGPSGQIRRAVRPGRQIDFVYDDDNHRLLKRVNGVPVRADVADGVLTEDHFFELVTIGGVVAGVLDNGRFTALLTDPRGAPFAGPDGTPGLASPFGVRTAHLGYAEVIDYARLGWDSDLDLIRMGVRDYDPRLGQFWTPDPLYFEDLDRCQRSPLQCALYGYAGGNPLSFVDPTGTDWMDWVAGGLGAVVGGLDAITFGQYSKIAFNQQDLAEWNTMGHYHTGHVMGESVTTTGMMAVGIGEIGTAVKAGQLGVRVLVTADGMTMLAVTDATVTAAAGTAKLTYGTANFATALTDKGGGTGGGLAESTRQSRTGDPPSTTEPASTRKQAMVKAQEHAQVPRASKGGKDIPFDELNQSSRGTNAAELQRRGTTNLGRRDAHTRAEVFDHPDGHPDLTGPDQPPHHAGPHVHATNAAGDEIVIPYPGP